MLRCCTKCNNTFPATTDFFQRAQQGRLRGECKQCTATFHAAHYQKHKEHYHKRTSEWIKAHPDARRATTKRYRDSNKEKCKAAVRAWFKKDPEHARRVNREKTKRWYLRHLDHARTIRRATVKRRRALKRGAGVATLTTADWQSIKRLYKFRCAYCGKRKPLTQHHVIPLSRGGNHTKENVVPACITCNCSKKAGPPPVPVQPLLFL